MLRFFSAGLATLVALSALIVMLVASVSPASAAACRFDLGFQVLHDAMPDVVGECKGDQHYNPSNGDALQETTNGLLVWRKADNFTAFTDGYRSWVNGLYGIQERLNSARFDWEPPDPQAINLTLDDMPAGFVPVDELNRFQYNEEIVRDAPNPQKMAQRLQDTGRLYGYVSGFAQLTAAGLAGTLLASSDVDLYANADGAHRSLQQYDEMLAEYGLPGTAMPAPAIGDEARAFEVQITRTEGGRELSFAYYYLVFRKGTIVAGLSTFGLTGGVDFNENVKYARILESRIR